VVKFNTETLLTNIDSIMASISCFCV